MNGVSEPVTAQDQMKALGFFRLLALSGAC